MELQHKNNASIHKREFIAEIFEKNSFSMFQYTHKKGFKTKKLLI